MEIADGVLAGHEEQSPGWAALIQAASPSLRLDRAAECGPTDATTRLGGLASVDTGFVWPRTAAGQPLSLIGVLNCDEVNVAAGKSVLPSGVLLSFFYEASEQVGWGFDPADSQCWRVVRTDTTAARPADPPDGAITFPSRAVALRRVMTVPEARESPIHDLWVADRAGVIAMYNALERLSTNTNATGQEIDPFAIRPRHRVFGWPDLVQNPMQLECQLVSHGIYMGDGKGYHDPQAAELRSSAADWALLLQIDTDSELGWMWGDAGTIYYWIRRQDLASGTFERTWMMLQSG